MLKIISDTNTPFYLTGGTVLSRCYFHHRYSEDLDFFVNSDIAEDLFWGKENSLYP
ncbi:nucleotidyl transferase AbiEii/AbiGii toxin family protein [Candidatus Desulfatibia sp.]|uniref:nucleotidyl transferase AbiEii/AbiGii toxin family protein n=1 Tax=Candidatus Desulfatibia sp. TaxID=3101189 RepID=UPI0039B8F407